MSNSTRGEKTVSGLTEIADDVLAVLTHKHGLDEFEVREFFGLMFLSKVVDQHRSGVITNLDAYMSGYRNMVMLNMGSSSQPAN